MSSMNTNKEGNDRTAEFPLDLASLPEGVSRRRFVQWVGASLAVAGFSGCARAPLEEIVPHVKAPEYRVPGKAKHYATILRRGNRAMGVVVSQIEGRPQLIEGNASHPASAGGADAVTQAEILNLYDWNRLRSIREGKQIRTQEAWLVALREQLRRTKVNGGRGFGIVLPSVFSPSEAELLRIARESLPELRLYRLHDYESSGLLTEGGEEVNPDYRPDQAKVVISLDLDFLSSAEMGPRVTKKWIAARQSESSRPILHVLEPAPTLTGGKADHRRALPLGEIEALALALEADLSAGEQMESRPWPWYEVLYQQLREAGPDGLVLASARLSTTTQRAVARINRTLGSESRLVGYRLSDDLLDFQLSDVNELRRDLEEGRLQSLLSLGVNPVRQLAETDEEVIWKERIHSLQWSACLALRENDTTTVSQWSLPQAHALESWGDGVAFEGTASIQQPLIEPLFGGVSALEILAEVAGRSYAKGYDIVRDFWRQRFTGSDFEAFWRQSLFDGFIDGERVRFSARLESEPLLNGPSGAVAREGLGELVSQAGGFVEDEASFSNVWLQELPNPVSKQAWGNAFWLSPEWADELSVEAGEWIRVEWANGVLEGPALPVMGMASKTIALPRGYGGRIAFGKGERIGVGSRSLEESKRVVIQRVKRLGRSERLALAQAPGPQDSPIRIKGDAEQAEVSDSEQLASLYPKYDQVGYAWGMVIDLDACTGCSACMIACQAENNIPVVGKEQFAKGREMNWIRLERYFTAGDEESDGRPVYQPVACMHCEKAPCEVVCPVAATTHSNEGVNEMTYNRCVGTRYCSNNCPYRARRFNFIDYRKGGSEVTELQLNPNVTVRSNGVMEKCTYCIQRVEEARIRSIREHRQIRDGEVVTACQSVCPAEAIVFGDVNNPDSKVSKKRSQKDNYVLLEDEGTRPRTSYSPIRSRPANEGGGSL